MKLFISAVILLTCSVTTAKSQSIQISEVAATASNNPNQFTVAGHTVNIVNDNISYGAGNIQSSSVNKLTALSTILTSNSVDIFGGDGKRILSSSSYTIKGGDSSVQLYTKPNGGFIIRENIANFLFFDSWGEIDQSLSNSSQSTEGESVSELAADPAFKTVVLYNPKIVREGVEGSRASIVNTNFTTSTIYSSNDRAIRKVVISDDAQFIGIISYKSGTDDALELMDRFGNKLADFSFDQGIMDAVISDDGRYVTLRSNGRVGVYSTISGDRIGSTSLRSRLIFAEYISDDNTILAVTGEDYGTTISDIQFHAINVEQRKVERQDYNRELASTELISFQLDRKGEYRYELFGFNKTLEIQVQF